MAVPRRIGLVLGTELALPAALEGLAAGPLAAALPPELAGAGLEVGRVLLGPFDLADAIAEDLLLDRVSHWHGFAREFLKAAALDGRYVINNPFQFQAFEKAAGAALMARLGLDVPRTRLLPPKDQSHLLPGAAARNHRVFALESEAAAVGGLPAILKPHDGGGWIGVSRPVDADELHVEYDLSGRRVMMLQEEVREARFLRCLVVGPQVRVVEVAPGLPLHDRYLPRPPDLGPAELARVEALARLVCAVQGLEFNSVEVMLEGPHAWLIDHWNGVPDAFPGHLHVHFPWLLDALVRWLLFCLASGRRFRFSPRIGRYLELARDPEDAARDEAMADLADAYFERHGFEAFARASLGPARDAVRGFLASDAFGEILVAEVEATYPRHEQEAFLEAITRRVSRGLDALASS